MLKKTVKTIDKGIEFVEDWSLFLAVTIALAVAFVNIIMRKTTSQSLPWSDEVVRAVIYFTTYVGASAAIRNRSMIRIDAVPQLLRISRKPLSVFGHLAMVFFGALLMWLGGQVTYQVYLDPYATTTILEIPEWYLYAVLPLLGAMSIFRTILVMVAEWRELSENQS
jgi:TRAP-type C4-dicarboxylate transport system permease small subunit